MSSHLLSLSSSSPPSQFLHNSSSSTRSESSRFLFRTTTSSPQAWISLQHKLKSKGRVSCLFSGSDRQDQARKALESALGGKKNEFEKWDKEIKKREAVGGGGDTGGGGWFGWGRRFGWSNGDNFWQEVQQACLAILGIIVMYLIIAKGEVMLAVTINPLLFALRGTRNGLAFITSRILQKISPNSQAGLDFNPKQEVVSHLSAKEQVTRKWGN